jgi:hypothetical protein
MAIRCETALSFPSLISSQPGEDDGPRTHYRWRKPQWRNCKWEDLEDSGLLRHKPGCLAMQTYVVKFGIGKCLPVVEPTQPDEVGVYELLHQGRCVGEVWTTQALAKAGRRTRLDFLTMSWGLSLSEATLDDEYIPRWHFDAAKLPEFKKLAKLRTIIEILFRSALEQPTAGRFIDALLHAKQGEAQPKFLWLTVNLLPG